ISRAETFQNFQHALGADAAESALAARFGLGEAEEEAGHIDHAVAVIEHHQSPRAHDGAGLNQSVVVDWRVGQALRDAPPGGSPELHGLELPAVLDATA